MCFLCSGTSQCCLQRGGVFSREVTIIDTPGLSETFDPAVRSEIFRCINTSEPVPHAVLLVFKVFTEAGGGIVRQVEEIFGKNIWSRTFVLFTQEDQAEPEIQNQLQEAGPELMGVLRSSRYQVLNIDPEYSDRQQVWDLLHAVGKMVSDNI